MGLLSVTPGNPAELAPYLLRDDANVYNWKIDNAFHLRKKAVFPGGPFIPVGIARLDKAAKGQAGIIPSESPSMMFGLPADLVLEHRVAVMNVPVARNGFAALLGGAYVVRQYVELSRREAVATYVDGEFQDSIALKGLYGAVNQERNPRLESMALELIAAHEAEMQSMIDEIKAESQQR